MLPMREAAITGRAILGAELEIIKDDGSSRHILGNAVPLLDDRGNVRGCLGTFVDITERKNAERRLAFEHAVSHILTETTSIEDAMPRILKVAGEWMRAQFAALWLPDSSGEYLTCENVWVEPGADVDRFKSATLSARFEPGTGLPGRVWASRQSASIDQIAQDANFPRAESAQACGLQSGLAFPLGLGEEFFGAIEFFTRRPLDHDPSLQSTMTAIGHDIAQLTRRRRAEESLRQSEANLEDFFDNAVVGLHWIGPDGVILRANHAELRMLGYSEHEFVGHHISEFHVDQDNLADMLARLARGETLVNHEARMRCKDGSIKDVLIDCNVLWKDSIPGGEFVHSRCFTRDVTDRRDAEATRRQSEARFRRIFECNMAPMGVWENGLGVDDGRVTSANDALLNLIGYTRQDLAKGRVNWRDLTPPEYAALDAAALEECRRHGVCVPFEKEYFHKDGRRIPILIGAAMFDDADENDVERGVFFALDLTERKRAEAALASGADEYRAMFDLAGAGKAQTDPRTGRFTRVNRRLCEITGYTIDELLQRTFFDITHPDDREADTAQFQRMIRGEINEYSMEKRYLGKNGRTEWVLVTTSLVRDERGHPRHTVSVILDVTDRKLAEQELERHRQHLEDLVAQRTAALEESHRQLRQSERLAALGTLAAGLGHDIGNLVLPVMCRLDALVSQSSPEVQHELNEAREAVARLRHMSNGLRLFALDPADADASTGTTNLHTWWAQTGALLQRALPRKARLEVVFAPDIPELAIAPHQLTHAVLNLLTNAGEAIGVDGRVRISAGIDARGENARVLVSDNGRGMTEEVRQHALEPFFTTKKRSLSTGLGLSLVRGVVQGAGGSVEIESAPGRGTTVILTLPLLPDVASDDLDATAPVARVALRDPRVTSYAHTLLRSSGFSVRDAGDVIDDNELLWITEPGVHSLESVRDFLRERPNRRVVAVVRDQQTNGWNMSGVALVDGSYRTMRKALEHAWNEVRKGVLS